MKLFHKLRALFQRHPILIVSAVLNRIPLRPIQFQYFQRFELNGYPRPPQRRTGSTPARPADSGDLELLVRCQDKRATFERRFAAGEHCLVSIVDGSVVGYEWFTAKGRHTEERFGYTIPIPGDALYAYDAYTSEALRGRGIWSQITLAAAELMRSERRNRLIAHIDFGNDTSMAAHVKVGYHPIGWYLFVNVCGIRFLRQTRGANAS
jgi:GNAT superfamily N-acetyltransferase